MATIKLSAIVTEIAGSVGGTTFRRFANGTIMQNKVSGASKNRLLNNPALPGLTTIINQWSVLAQATRDLWIAQALLFQFPDKFGILKNLSGRQLYIKLNSQAKFSGFTPPDVNTLSSLVEVTTIKVLTLETVPFAEIELFDPIDNVNISIRAEQIPNASVGFSFKKREIIFNQIINLTINVDFTTAFFNKFPLVQIGDIFNLYIVFTNSSGFRSQMSGRQGQIFV